MRDADRDLFADNECCNEAPDGRRRCGADCDDLNEAIRPGAMSCSTADTSQTEIRICQSGEYQVTFCSAGRVCEVLENGTGICLPVQSNP